MIARLKLLSILGLFFAFAPFARAMTIDSAGLITGLSYPPATTDNFQLVISGVYPTEPNFPSNWIASGGCSGACTPPTSFDVSHYVPLASSTYTFYLYDTYGSGPTRHVSNSISYLVFTYNGSSFNFVSSGSTSTTEIITTTPNNNALVATSTSFTFGVTGYISENDFVDGMKVSVQYSNGGFESSQLVGPVFSQIQQPDSRGTFTWNITSAGAFDFSTTTSLTTIGNYDLQARITKPKFSVLGINFLTTDVDYKHNHFIVATSTAYGSLRDNVQNEWETFTGVASSSINTSVCNPISGNFSIVPCTSLLFIPSTASLVQSTNILHDTILAKFPWGYVTRLIVILTDTTSSTTLPAFTASVDFRAGSSGSSDVSTLTFDPQDMIAGGAAAVASIQDTRGYGITLRDVAEPIIKLIVALFVIIIIWHDLMGMVHHRKHQ